MNDPVVNLESAAELILPTDSNYFQVTGTTTITSLKSLTIPRIIGLEFTNVLRLVHNERYIKLPDGHDITTSPGAFVVFMDIGFGRWRALFTRGTHDTK